MNYLSKYQDIIGKINYVLFLILVFTLTSPDRYVRVFWMFWLISWGLEGRFLNKKNYKFDRTSIPSLLLVILVCWEIISMFWACNISNSLNSISKHIYFFVLLLISIVGFNKHYDTKTIMKTLIAGALVSCVTYIIILYTSYNGSIPFIHYFEEDINQYKHRLYYSTILTLAIICTCFLISNTNDRKQKRNAIIQSLFVIGILLAVIYMTGSRASILTLIVLFCIMIYRLYHNKKQKWFIYCGILCFFIISLYLFATKHPRMNNAQLVNIENIKQNHKDIDAEPRMNIWAIALDGKNVEKYFWHGIGKGNSRDLLASEYERLEMSPIYLEKKFGTHNQYLNYLMELGIFGLLFFIFILIKIPSCYTKKAKIFAIYFILMFALNIFTEDMFGRMNGIFTFCIGIMIMQILQREGQLFPKKDS